MATGDINAKVWFGATFSSKAHVRGMGFQPSVVQSQIRLEPSISFAWLVANAAHESRWSCLCRLLAMHPGLPSVCDPHSLPGSRSIKHLRSPFHVIHSGDLPVRKTTPAGIIHQSAFEPQIWSASSPRAIISRISIEENETEQSRRTRRNCH